LQALSHSFSCSLVVRVQRTRLDIAGELYDLQLR